MGKSNLKVLFFGSERLPESLSLRRVDHVREKPLTRFGSLIEKLNLIDSVVCNDEATASPFNDNSPRDAQKAITKLLQIFLRSLVDSNLRFTGNELLSALKSATESRSRCATFFSPFSLISFCIC